MVKLADNYKEVNAKEDKNSEKSIFNYYKKLIALRKEDDLISDGKFEALFIDHDYLLAYKRTLNDKELININNFPDQEVSLNLSELIEDIKGYKILISNYNLDELSDHIRLRAYESLAIEN